VRGLIDQLKEKIRQDGRSLNQIGKASGVDAARLSRFLSGQRGLSIEAIDSLFKVLRLQVVKVEPGRKRKKAEKEEGAEE
jgi:transcriptional regulator with XRE-family HTH domain